MQCYNRVGTSQPSAPRQLVGPRYAKIAAGAEMREIGLHATQSFVVHRRLVAAMCGIALGLLTLNKERTQNSNGPGRNLVDRLGVDGEATIMICLPGSLVTSWGGFVSTFN